EDREFCDTSRRENMQARTWALTELARMNVRTSLSEANMIWLEVRDRELPSKMAARGVRISNSPEPLQSDWARVSVGTQAQMKTFVQVFRELRSSSGWDHPDSVNQQTVIRNKEKR